MSEDEPVGYLGGATGEDPYAVEDPYGQESEGDGEVAGLLGGATGEEELPALPAAEDAAYTARDFMDSGEESYADPYADPYAETTYEDPYALPPSDDYGDYEGYDDAAAADSDPSYFDSMGHEDYDPHATDVATRTAEPETQYDDDAPKTISQQDAESIIRRITTKRILPPDQEVKPVPRKLTPSGGGLRMWPILVALLLLAGGAVWLFREPIAERYPQLAPYLGVELEQETPVEEIKVDPPEVVLKRKMLEKVRLSEMKAFGITEADLAPPKGASPRPGSSPSPAGGDDAAGANSASDGPSAPGTAEGAGQ
ncbi:MAG: hypothetical protein D6731_15745 [Planctomycetota bacterium]|nr:MAG: hypothetical protein D6731_15745 [Planctomycetota bacterium]